MNSLLKKNVVPCLIPVVTLLFVFGEAARSESQINLDKQIQLRNQETQRLLLEKRDALVLIDDVIKREEQVLKVLEVLDESIKHNRNQLEVITFKIKQRQRKTESARKKIKNLLVEIKKDKVKIEGQLKALFYIRRVRKMTLFIGLSSFENYFRNQYLLQNSTKLDVQALFRLEVNLNALKQEKKNLESQEIELAGLEQAEKEQKELVEFEQQQQFTYLQHLRKNRETRTKYLREIQVELERLNDTIFSLEEKKDNQIKAKSFQGFRKQKNKLPSPVQGNIIHQFGQKHSIYFTLFKRGILVETSEDVEVKSILPGRVVWVGPFRGYQTLVILDHGKGSFSVYGNLEDVFVAVDDLMGQQESIGTVAYNSQAGRHLFYFETRYNKWAVDPVQWLKKPAWQ